jgi:hypothetical protein
MATQGIGGYQDHLISGQDRRFSNCVPGSPPGNNRRWKDQEKSMHYLYGSKTGTPSKLVATFDSEQQLLAYVA